jgi:hypothetical protein
MLGTIFSISDTVWPLVIPGVTLGLAGKKNSSLPSHECMTGYIWYDRYTSHFLCHASSDVKRGVETLNRSSRADTKRADTKAHLMAAGIGFIMPHGYHELQAACCLHFPVINLQIRRMFAMTDALSTICHKPFAHTSY